MEKGGWEYDCDKRCKIIDNTHYFNTASCIYLEQRIIGYSDGTINEDESYSKFIAMCDLSPHKINIGDTIYLDGNHFIYQKEQGIHRMHKRFISK